MFTEKSEVYAALKKLDKVAVETMQNAMSGSDYDRGELEELRAGLSRAHETIAKLVFVMLVNKNLTRGEAAVIIAEYGFEAYINKESSEEN